METILLILVGVMAVAVLALCAIGLFSTWRSNQRDSIGRRRNRPKIM